MERLDASLVIHHLYGNGILAWKELEDLVKLKDRRDQAVALLMAMNRRSVEECYQFSVLLSETEGISDVDCSLMKQCASEYGASVSLLNTSITCLYKVVEVTGSPSSQRWSSKYQGVPSRQEVATLLASASANERQGIDVEKSKTAHSTWKSWSDIPRQSCWPWNCVVRVPPNRLVVGDQADLHILDLFTNKWKSYNLGNVNIHSVFRCGSIDPYILLLDRSKNKFVVEQYNMGKTFRQHVTYLPPSCQSQLQLGHHMSVAADNDRIFIVSGRTSNYEALDCVWLYRLLNDWWQKLSDMSIKRCACSPFVLDGALCGWRNSQNQYK